VRRRGGRVGGVATGLLDNAEQLRENHRQPRAAASREYRTAPKGEPSGNIILGPFRGEFGHMYLENTTLAPAGSWRASKIETDLIWDIATHIAQSREQPDACNAPYMAEAEQLLRLFISNEDRYPVNSCEVDARFPGCLAHRIKPRLVT
jgi:hypothetical protein